MIVRWMRYVIAIEPNAIVASCGDQSVLGARAVYTHASPTGRHAKYPRIVLTDINVRRGHFRLRKYIESGVFCRQVYAVHPGWWPPLPEIKRCPTCGHIISRPKDVDYGPIVQSGPIRSTRGRRGWQPEDPADWSDVT